jgi:hypothetical protein
MASIVAIVPWVLAGAETDDALRSHPQDFVGTLSCTSVSCHSRAESRSSQNEVSGHAYVLWMGRDAHYRDGRKAYDPRAVLERTSGDPHALAAQRILEPRFQEVLGRVSLRADGTQDARVYEKCAVCHDPLAIQSTVTPALSERDREAVEGIGCESCHGGGRRWLTEHYQRGVSRDRLNQLGMVDTKDLLVRSRLCAGCHVGSVDQDMNHDMIAAGHPPLRFEQASYEALIPQKHWDDRPQRMSEPNYEVRLWAAGRIAAAEATFTLLYGRAERAKHGPWPEFAEWNCFACHQPLQSEGKRQALAATSTSYVGVPAWQTWNTALATVVPQANTESLASSLKKLQDAMERSPLSDAMEIAMLTADAQRSLQHISLEQITRRGLLNALEKPSAATGWDELCQQFAALTAVERSQRDAGKPADERIRRQLRPIAEALKFDRPGIEWPAMFEGSGTMSMADVSRELESVRRALVSAEENR